MSFFPRPILWFFLALACGALVEYFDSSPLLSSVSEIYALPLPAHFRVVGRVLSPHFSGESLVFDLSNNGRITCYFRRPPETLFVFPGETYLVYGTVVSTPRGRLCVVDRVDSVHAS